MTIEQLFTELKTKDSAGLSAIEKIQKNIQECFQDNPFYDKNLITPEYIKSAIQQLSIRQDFFLEDYFSPENNKDSIFGIVQENVDMDDSNINIERIISGDKDYWKDSINTLIRNFYNNLVPPRKEINGNEIEYREIIESENAALSFSGPTNYVYENTNNTNNTFDMIISEDDYSKDGLHQSHHINETNSRNEQEKSLLNLIMPKNSRRVEVIDLNRNFWVISNNLTLILKFLFEDNNLIQSTYIGITKEITELWENLLYMRGALYIAYGYKARPLHIEIMYMPSKDYQTFKANDNFAYDSTSSFSSAVISTIKNRFHFMKQKYPNCNLCIIPIIRSNNYEHNYYSTERYPGILLSKYNDSNFQFYQFQYNGNLNSIVSVSALKSENASIYLDGIGSRDIEDEENEYNSIYIRPFSKIDQFKELKPYKYYSGYRVTPTLTYTYLNGVLKITSLKFLYTDIMYASISGVSSASSGIGQLYNNDTIIYNFSTKKINNSYIRMNYENTNNFVSLNASIDDSSIMKKYVKKDYKYYLGECISGTTYSDFADFNLSLTAIDLRPDITSSTNATSLIITGTEVEKEEKREQLTYGQLEIIQDNTQWQNIISKNDTAVLSIETKKDNLLSNFSSLDVNMKIYVGRHKIDLWGDNGESTRTITYKALTSNLLGTQTITLANQPSHQRYEAYNGAVLYDPLYNKIYKYPLFFFSSYYAPYTNYVSRSLSKDGVSSWYRTTGTETYSYLYIKKGEQLSSDNWIVKYIQVCGATNFENSALKGYEGVTTWGDVIEAFWPTSLKTNRWDKNNTMDSYNPSSTKIDYDCWALPDSVRESHKYSLSGETAVTYNIRKAQYEATISTYKKNYISAMNQYNKNTIYYTTRPYYNCHIHFEYIDIKIDKFGASYYDYNEKFYTDMEWLKNNFYLVLYLPKAYIINYYPGLPALKSSLYDKEHYTTAQITKAIHLNETFMAMEGKILHRESKDDPVEEWQLSLKTPYKTIYNREFNKCNTNIETETSNYDRWNAGFENSLKDFKKHYVLNTTITTYPLNVHIRTHLFTPKGYACKIQSLDFPEESTVDNIITNSTYSIQYLVDGAIAEEASSSEEAYNLLRNQLPNSKSDRSAVYTYYMDSSDANRIRTINNKKQSVFLDYERFPRNGIDK